MDEVARFNSLETLAGRVRPDRGARCLSGRHQRAECSRAVQRRELSSRERLHLGQLLELRSHLLGAVVLPTGELPRSFLRRPTHVRLGLSRLRRERHDLCLHRPIWRLGAAGCARWRLRARSDVLAQRLQRSRRLHHVWVGQLAEGRLNRAPYDYRSREGLGVEHAIQSEDRRRGTCHRLTRWCDGACSDKRYRTGYAHAHRAGLRPPVVWRQHYGARRHATGVPGRG
jgi:hypothetical protein